MEAVCVDFPKNKCNFLHKNKLAIVRRVQFLTGRRPTRSFSPGAVATIALQKLAPERESVLDEFEAVVLVDGEVHFGGVVGPGAEHQLAGLLVERVEADVDGTHRPKHSARLPADTAVPTQHRLELRVLAVDALRAEQEQQRQLEQNYPRRRIEVRPTALLSLLTLTLILTLTFDPDLDLDRDFQSPIS